MMILQYQESPMSTHDLDSNVNSPGYHEIRERAPSPDINIIKQQLNTLRSQPNKHNRIDRINRMNIINWFNMHENKHKFVLYYHFLIYLK